MGEAVYDRNSKYLDQPKVAVGFMEYAIIQEARVYALSGQYAKPQDFETTK